MLWGHWILYIFSFKVKIYVSIIFLSHQIFIFGKNKICWLKLVFLLICFFFFLNQLLGNFSLFFLACQREEGKGEEKYKGKEKNRVRITKKKNIMKMYRKKIVRYSTCFTYSFFFLLFFPIKKIAAAEGEYIL